MGFTTACYIRKNSKELQDKLKELGYRICPCCDFENAVWLSTLISEPFKGEPSVHGIGYWDEEFEVSTPEQECEDFAKTTNNINCGTNEELFLALSALRDDTDVNQWFTDGKLWEKSNNNLPSHYMQLEGHKATVEEIIEHFKK
jgi:hypothetical protein